MTLFLARHPMISLRPSTTRSITTELVPDVIGTDERHALVHEVRKLRVVVDRPRPFHALRRLTMLRNWAEVPGFPSIRDPKLRVESVLRG